MTKKLDDIWLRPDVRFNGDEYYEYVLMYADERASSVGTSETIELTIE